MRTTLLLISLLLLNEYVHECASSVFRVNVNDRWELVKPDTGLKDEDLDATTPEFISNHGYPSEIHEVVTEDGYILEMHRIPHGKHVNSSGKAKNGTRPVAFLQHCLMCSSADWVLAGPEKSLGFILADEGYDVWLGNYRGNTYGRNHIHLDPSEKPFWEFSWDENAHYDLPAMITHVLDHTKQEKIFYVGHSMGTTGFLAMSAYHPEIYSKIELASLLAPVAYVAHLKGPIALVAPFEKQLQELFLTFSVGEFVRSSPFVKSVIDLVCKSEPTVEICDDFLFLAMGFDRPQLNNSLIDLLGHHTPAGSSVPTIAQYAQGINSKKFQMFDFDSEDKNIAKYGVPDPPQYDLTKVSAPVAAYWGPNDWLATPQDVIKITSEVPNLVISYEVPYEKFNHMDFLYAIDVGTLLYEEVLKQMRMRIPQ